MRVQRSSNLHRVRVYVQCMYTYKLIHIVPTKSQQPCCGQTWLHILASSPLWGSGKWLGSFTQTGSHMPTTKNDLGNGQQQKPSVGQWIVHDCLRHTGAVDCVMWSWLLQAYCCNGVVLVIVEFLLVFWCPFMISTSIFAWIPTGYVCRHGVHMQRMCR